MIIYWLNSPRGHNNIHTTTTTTTTTTNTNNNNNDNSTRNNNNNIHSATRLDPNPRKHS